MSICETGNIAASSESFHVNIRCFLEQAATVNHAHFAKSYATQKLAHDKQLSTGRVD